MTDLTHSFFSIDAVASIIGTVDTTKEEQRPPSQIKEEEIKTEDVGDSKIDLYVSIDMANSETLSAPETLDMKHEDDAVSFNIHSNIDINE